VIVVDQSLSVERVGLLEVGLGDLTMLRLRIALIGGDGLAAAAFREPAKKFELPGVGSPSDRSLSGLAP
jgi:hypothetical protein